MKKGTYRMVNTKEQAIIDGVLKKLDSLSIPYEKDITFKVTELNGVTLAQCRKSGGFYSVHLGTRIFNFSQMDTEEIIIHEILHTCPDSMCHTGKWKQHVTLVNESLGYNIARTKDINHYRDILPQTHKYKIYCDSDDCSFVTFRERVSAVTKNPSNYMCPHCGSSLSCENLK